MRHGNAFFSVAMAFISKSVLWFSMLSLVHCGLSAAQHKSYLRLSEQGSSFVPVDIIVQTLISLLTAMWATLGVAGEFREVRATAQLENKTFETAANCPNFYTFPRHKDKLVKDLLVYE
ncbi:membrane magnesium transporter 1-like isoform X3 [Varroa jacobsoni]|uniref:Membrane magnesium transporter n=1 Tax=Varroa destructor TaxID=109461 RepID=A0A7M7JUW5_VARDE|nr:membrane magnesium transporter 1-B-like isoform X3 [Varroa destructor]XP_022694120.1 membrane magnesium transporter 1-like isoform X3 [Varroa jacobsoni]